MKELEYLRDGIDILKKKWCQGSLRTDNGEVCAIGAVFAAAKIDHNSSSYKHEKNFKAAQQAVKTLISCLSEKHKGNSHPDEYYDIPQSGWLTEYNDSWKRKKKDVIHLFKRAIKKLETERKAKKVAEKKKITISEDETRLGADILRSMLGEDIENTGEVVVTELLSAERQMVAEFLLRKD